MAIPVPEKRILDFEEMGFGMFIHWGLYSQLGKGEWVQHIHGIPKEEYVKLQDTFTASKFDGQKIAQIAKKGGAKYITLTTRHHEGFSLYDTKGLNTYDAPHSPAGRDLIRDFVDGCRAEGIVPFFYHTTLDWWHPEFNGDFKVYLQYLRDSVEILCTEYGKIGGLWFDGNWSKKDADWEEDALYAVIRKHQPEAIIVNNTGLSARGEAGNLQLDSVTFEQGRPEPMNRDGMRKYFAAEMCHTMNAHWGHGAKDMNYKSLPHLIETLCACRKVGANYLLNVGPNAEGEITTMQAALMEGIGDWIRAVGQSIYKAKPCGVVGTGKNFALRDGNKMYFYVHDLSVTGDNNVTVEGGAAGEKSFTGVKGTISNLHWVDNDEALDFRQDENSFVMNATGYPYGTSLVVRVAEADIAD
ncbi:MAG: alpha-L-fucosidase [Clostridia bacterium]|nr:alpha-L-fucosidase [Clostridia bacterium]MBQ3592305.1 alpha-L-fucosidase [Clostridia bacterium]